LLNLVRILVLMSILWAALALVVQVIAARGGGRKDHAKRSGSPGKGIIYNFTVAMMPSHKETVRRHPVNFIIGALMHVGVIIALLTLVLLLVGPSAGFEVVALMRPLIALSLACGIYLVIRRVCSEDLRAISAPEDYIAIIATCGLLVFALLYSVHPQSQLAFLIYSGLLFVYLPLGKLRHAAFFFIARGDYGRRLGYRGVYPPSTARAE
jgi:hypothetical protein